MKIWKRGISLFLIVALLISVCPVKVQAADEEAQEGRVSVRTMKFGEKGGYEQDGTEERINVLVQNETLLVDVDWLCDKLHFIYDVRDGEQGFLWQAENADSVHINGADMNIKDIPEMGKMLAGYAKAFRDFSGGKELRIRKTYDSPIIFFLRTGSEQAYAYSRYMGDLNADLGANVVEKDGTIYVPFTMFLNLIDSYYCMDGDTVVLYPCQNTVVDILHSSNGLNERYSFDIAEDGGLGQFNYNLASGYDNFYRKVKSLFQGTVNLDWETVKQAWPSDTTNESEVLARQLCTNSKDDLDAISTTGALGADSLTVYSVFASIIKDGNKEKIKDNLYKAIQKWTEAKKELADPLGSISLDEYVNAYCNIGKEMKNGKSILTKIDDLESMSSNASNVFSILTKYCTLTSEISSAQTTYVNSVQDYIQSYQKLHTAAMDAKMIDQIGEKAELYSNKDVNPFKNADLMDELTQEVKNVAVSTLAGDVTGEMLSKFAAKTLVQLQLVSIFWDAGEFIADELSGGAFSALDAIHGGTYAMLLEHDSNEIVNNCVNHATDLDEYRQLEWIRLRSYYITRQDLITFYQPEKKSMPDVYEVAMADVLQDCSELQKMMAVLSVGLTGVTQDALDKCEKANVENNATLVESVDISSSGEDIAEAMNEAANFAWNWYWDNQYYDASKSIHENGITFCPITKSSVRSQVDLKRLTQQYFTADVTDKMMAYREWIEKNGMLYTSETEGLGGELANEYTIQVNKQSDKLYDIMVNKTCCYDGLIYYTDTYTMQYKRENGNWVFDKILAWPSDFHVQIDVVNADEAKENDTDSNLENFVTSECWMIEGDISIFRFLEDGKIYAWSEETPSFNARKSHAESGKNGQIVGSYTLNGNTLRLLFDGGISYQYKYDKSTGMFNSVDADGELYIAE